MTRKRPFFEVLTEEFLEQKYVRDEASIREIAYIAGCTQETVKEYIHKFGISVRELERKEGNNEVRARLFA